MKTIDGNIRLQNLVSNMHRGEHIYIHVNMLSDDEIKYLRSISGKSLIPDHHYIIDNYAHDYDAIKNGDVLASGMLYIKR